MTERRYDDDPEVAEGDLTEQHRALVDDPDDSGDEVPATVPDGVDPADAQEQRRPVGYDEDDYR